MPSGNLQRSNRVPLPLPTEGFYADTIIPTFMSMPSRNKLDDGNSRPGWVIRRKVGSTPAGGKYIARLPVDRSNGDLKAALYYIDDIVTDADSPSTLESNLYDPYGGDTNAMPSFVHMKGRCVLVINGNPRILIHDGSSMLLRAPMSDAGNPTLAAGSSAHTLTAGTYRVKVREYDEKTGTFSGPSQRLTASALQSVSAGQRLQVTPAAFQTRTTHWQVQMCLDSNPDVPESFEIHYNARDSGGAIISDATGLIPTTSTTAYFTDDPASGAQFEFRTLGAVTLYRHGKMPAADFVCQSRGRAFYASRSALWLCWSEPDNPEHTYAEASDPTDGFNNVTGEDLIDSVISPCTGLAANESAIFYFTRSGIVVGEGSWALVGENRDARLGALTQNTLGSVSGSIMVVDQEVYFPSQEGPAVVSAQGVYPLMNDAVRRIWEKRNPKFDHRIRVGYDPWLDLVMFAFVSRNAPIAGIPDTVLAWHRRRGRWCAPFDLIVTEFLLHRLTTDGAEDRGTRLLFGGPYGTIQEWGVGHADGPADEADEDDIQSTSDTGTSVTKTSAGWTTDEHRGRSVALRDTTTGNLRYRIIRTNTTDTLTFEGSVTDAGAGWIFNIGGYPRVQMVPILLPEEGVLQLVNPVLDDQLSRRSLAP